jgi:hypothetical protein
MIIPQSFQLPQKKLFITGGIFCTILILISVSILFYQHHITEGYNRMEQAPNSTPREQAEFESGLLVRMLREEQISQLTSYGWADEKHQYAHVPLERAFNSILRKQL